MSFAVVDRFEKGAELLAYAMQGINADQALALPGPGAWSLAELAAHLLDCETVHAVRIKQVIAENRPILEGFDETAWLERLDSKSMPIDESVALFVASRRWLTRVLRRLDETDFARVGLHTERGEESLASIVAIAAHHVDHHLKFVYAKRGNLGIAIYPRYTTD